MSETLWYPSVDDVLAIHENIVAEYPKTEPGVGARGSVQFTVEYVESGNFDDVPNTIHGKAFHLLRLLVANHPFWTGTNEPHSTPSPCFTSSTDSGSHTTRGSGTF